MKNAKRVIDLTGLKFGRLLVLRMGGRSSCNKVMWVCQCDCGTVKEVVGGNLRTGLTMSCGCYAKEATRAAVVTHGLSASHPLYSAWKNIRGRCYNPNHKAFKYYGARGITVCARWEDFKNFIDDMGPKPSPKHSVGRINNDGDYGPDNCRWETAKEQARNFRRNVKITVGQDTKCVSEWCEQTRLSPSAIYSRVSKGWKPDVAAIIPKKYFANYYRLVTTGAIKPESSLLASNS